MNHDKVSLSGVGSQLCKSNNHHRSIRIAIIQENDKSRHEICSDSQEILARIHLTTHQTVKSEQAFHSQLFTPKYKMRAVI